MVRVSNTGRVTVYTGAAAIGQGLQTALAQVAASELGLRADEITVVPGDTSGVAIGLGAFASRQTVTAGSSVLLAARAVADKAKKLASHILEAAEHDLELADGEVRVVGAPQRSVKLAELSRILKGAPGYGFPPGVDPGLDASVNWRTDALAYANARHVAEVEVDMETGEARILRYFALQDSGVLINPMMVDGQDARLDRCTWHRQRAVRMDGRGRCRTAGDHDLRGLSAADRNRTAVNDHNVQGDPPRSQPARLQGRRRGLYDPDRRGRISAVEDALSPFGVRRTAQVPIMPNELVELIAGRSNPRAA